MFFPAPSGPLDAHTVRAIAESTNAMLEDLKHAAADPGPKDAAPATGRRAPLRKPAPRRAR